jgi:hypothetical protein
VIKENGMKKRTLLIALIAVAALLIGGGLTAGILLYKHIHPEGEDENENTAEENEDIFSEYTAYPELEPLIGKTLDEVKGLYPGGEDQVSNTTWGDKWYSYSYENDLFKLYVDGKATKIVDFAGLAVKALKGCAHDETVLDLVDAVVPYAHIDPALIGDATNPGIYQGAPTFYNYKQGYAVGITCNSELDGTTTLEVSYFTVPDYYFEES